MNIPQRILLGPGPSDVPARVLAAMSLPTVGHLDPAFLEVMDEVRSRLRSVFQTNHEVTLAVSGTGSAGMECAVANVVEPGDKVLVCVNGVFGNRLVDVAERYGAMVERLDAPWGEAFKPDQILEAADRVKPTVTVVVNAETSTGAFTPVDGLGRGLHRLNSLLLVDCVTSLGGLPVCIDDWEIDVAYSGSQKCLSCPPGLAPVTFSPRALERLEKRKTKVQSWYLDVSLVRQYWGQERFYHHTAPINMLYALNEALAMVLEEGLEPRFARHRAVHELLRDGLDELGIRFVCPEGSRLPMLNAIHVPQGVDDAGVRRSLLEDYGIEIGAGLGEFKGKAWRIGLMGHGATRRNVATVLAALKEILAR
jgi:alanine-glyoxylate transaminase/serine-glyoxylate transaminase/serine-pyruvate transaminase